MLKLVAVLILLIITVLAIALGKAYKQLPPLELKRRARENDSNSKKIYRAAVYEKELSLLLSLTAVLSASGVIIILARGLVAWLSFIIVAILMWFSFTWLPFIDIAPAKYLSGVLAPVFAWVIERLNPILRQLIRVHGHGTNDNRQTKLYQIDDMLAFLDKQSKEPENRIPKERLQMAAHSLTFGDILVEQAMIPRRVVVFVNANDSIGPVLLDELTKSGHSRFPAYETKESNIVGTLYLKDIIDNKKGGLVSTVMKKDVFYVHEDSSLGQVLKAFLKTKHHLFMVVDKFEEIVGIITIEDVIEQIIGKQIVDEFDKYEDLRAVAEHLAHKEHSDKDAEVIE